MADPTIRTVKEAAQRAGCHPITAYKAQRNASVQREIARIQSEEGDTARSGLRLATAVLADGIRRTQDPDLAAKGVVAFSQAISNAGDEEPRSHPKLTKLMLAYRFLLNWTSGHASACSPQSCGCNRVERASVRLQRIEEAIALYAAAGQR